jgi:hypothetical protein
MPQRPHFELAADHPRPLLCLGTPLALFLEPTF